jgi:hypothetical protein
MVSMIDNYVDLRKGTVSQVLIPKSKARLSTDRASASGIVQLMLPPFSDGSPNDMAPRITLETLRPDFPSLEDHC